MDDSLIEQIVGNVMQQLATSARDLSRQTDDGRTNDASAAGDSSDQPARGTSGEPDSLGVGDPPLTPPEPEFVVFTENVLTAESLEQQLNGARHIRIGPQTVLTPSARDVLRARGIQWRRQQTTEAKPTADRYWTAIVVQSSTGVLAALNEAQRATGVAWKRELVGQPDEAVSLAISALCRGEADGVVVTADAAELIACSANRKRQVRAAVVEDAGAVERVKRQMGANLLCVSPQAKSFFQMRNLLRAFTSGGPPKAPENWDT